MWNVECGMWNEKCGMRNVECGTDDKPRAMKLALIAEVQRKKSRERLNEE